MFIHCPDYSDSKIINLYDWPKNNKDKCKQIQKGFPMSYLELVVSQTLMNWNKNSNTEN